MPRVTTTTKCCNDKPRCTTCLVVLRRLEKQGLAECCAAGKGTRKTFEVEKKIPGKVLRAARAR